MLNQSHTYDYQLAATKKELERHLLGVSKLLKEERVATLISFATKYLQNTPGLANFNAIVSDFIAGNGNNRDHSNNIDAIDLLHLCVKLSLTAEISKDVIELLIIQLADISNGPCPIGRVARLLQVVKSFADYL